jgi:hypothetical protein
MAAIMEKRAREIFRDALALHYIDGICAAGEEVESWLKTHGGWLPDPQEVYGDGTPLTQPEDEGWDVTSKEPEKAMKEAKGVMSLLAEFLRDGIAEEMGQCDLKASAQKWLEDLAGQGNLYLFSCGPNRHTVAAGSNVEEALAKIRNPEWPFYECTLEKATSLIEELRAKADVDGLIR